MPTLEFYRAVVCMQRAQGFSELLYGQISFRQERVGVF